MWKSTSELGYLEKCCVGLRENLHAIEQMLSRGQRRVDGVESPRHRADAATETTSRRWRGGRRRHRRRVSHATHPLRRPRSRRTRQSSAFRWAARRRRRGASSRDWLPLRSAPRRLLSRACSRNSTTTSPRRQRPLYLIINHPRARPQTRMPKSATAPSPRPSRPTPTSSSRLLWTGPPYFYQRPIF